MTMLQFIIFIVLPILILTGAFAVFMLFRNSWVFKNRIRMIDEDYEKYHCLQDYNYILNRFWIWDFDKFLKPKF